MQETEIQENQENRTPPKSLSLQLEDLEGEEWKDIEGFSKYKISNYGRFRHIGSQRIKTWNWNKKRFPRVSLHSSDGKCRPFLVKELTSAYFLENPEQFTNTICKDGDKLNNSIDNLVWDGFSVTKDGFRKCKRCLCKKSLNNYSLSKHNCYATYCNDCEKIRHMDKYWKNREKILAREKILGQKPHRKARKKAYAKVYNQVNKKRIREVARDWERRNPDKVKAKVKRGRPRMAKYVRERNKTNPQFKAYNIVRVRLRHCLNKYNKKKQEKTFKYLGCSFEYFTKFMAEMFDERTLSGGEIQQMTWENHGKFWEVEHRIPCAYFNLTKEEEIYKCFNYKNMWPAWKEYNAKKNDFLEDGTRARDKIKCFREDGMIKNVVDELDYSYDL